MCVCKRAAECVCALQAGVTARGTHTVTRLSVLTKTLYVSCMETNGHTRLETGTSHYNLVRQHAVGSQGRLLGWGLPSPRNWEASAADD